MNNKLLNQIEYLKKSSEEDFIVMNDLFLAKHYSWALFIGHLVVEKILKAYYISIKHEMPPFTHNLLRLAQLAEMDFDENTKLFLSTVTNFNINARYDDYKQNFNKLCTFEFTNKWISQIKDYYKWIGTQL